MVRLGNFFFRYRNAIFPISYLLLFWNSPVIFGNRALAFAIGLALALSGQIIRAATIGLAYIVRGGKRRQVYAKDLVQEGIFAHCRNPLYVGNFLVILGLGFAADSLYFLVFGVPFFAIAYAAIISAEEKYLRQKFGQEYEDYCARVNRLAPKLTGLRQTFQGMEFNWQRLIVKEYGSAYAWMAAMLLLLMKPYWINRNYTHPSALLWVLIALLALLTLAYAWARYLKKRGILVAEPIVEAAAGSGVMEQCQP